jgi:hypothetical protein
MGKIVSKVTLEHKNFATTTFMIQFNKTIPNCNSQSLTLHLQQCYFEIKTISQEFPFHNKS